MIWALACAWERPVDAVLDDYGTVPAFALQDQSGRSVGLADLAGRVWVADFIFTRCPDVCPMLSTHMAEVQARYAAEDRLRLVSFTVDPGWDTPPVLAAYGQRFGAGDRWLFLTGDITAIRAVVVDGFKQILQPGADATTILHGSRFVVVDGDGHIRAFADPTEPGKRQLYAAIDALL